MATSLQHAARFRREQARRRAFAAGHAWAVGYSDYRLQQMRNPYPVGSVHARNWEEGYSVAALAWQATGKGGGA